MVVQFVGINVVNYIEYVWSWVVNKCLCNSTVYLHDVMTIFVLYRPWAIAVDHPIPSGLKWFQFLSILPNRTIISDIIVSRTRHKLFSHRRNHVVTAVRTVYEFITVSNRVQSTKITMFLH